MNRRVLVAGAVAAAGLLAACVGGGGDDAAPSTTVPMTTTAAPSPEALSLSGGEGTVFDVSATAYSRHRCAPCRSRSGGRSRSGTTSSTTTG